MLTVSLPPDLEDYVTAKVQSGEYFFAAEVAAAGLYLLEDQNTRGLHKSARLEIWNGSLGCSI